MRAGILVHLVEPMPMDQSDPIGNYHAIRKELAEYSSDLAARPEILAITKAELPDAEIVHEMLCANLGRKDIFLISAVTGQGLNTLVNKIATLLAEQNAELAAAAL